jgi:hypothetical protein
VVELLQVRPKQKKNFAGKTKRKEKQALKEDSFHRQVLRNNLLILFIKFTLFLKVTSFLPFFQHFCV